MFVLVVVGTAVGVGLVKSMLWADAAVDGRGSIERFHQREVRVRERSKCQKCSRRPLRLKSDPQWGFYVRMEKRILEHRDVV